MVILSYIFNIFKVFFKSFNILTTYLIKFLYCVKTAPIAKKIARLWRGELQFADFTSFRDHIDFNNPTEESFDAEDQIHGNQILAPSTNEEI